MDERDLSQERMWYYEQVAKKCLKALEQNNIGVRYARDRGEACSIVLGLIPDSVTVGLGDSVTLLQTGITQEVEKRWGNRVFNPFPLGSQGVITFIERDPIEVMRKAASADVFLTGVNAVTLDGKLVSTDGFGNRVGPLIFGPKKIIVVAGANKIVPNVDEALKRIRKVAAPINARRHYLKHSAPQLPCAATGGCIDCRHPWRICNFTVIVEFQMNFPEGQPRITVVLVGEDLGI